MLLKSGNFAATDLIGSGGRGRLVVGMNDQPNTTIPSTLQGRLTITEPELAHLTGLPAATLKSWRRTWKDGYGEKIGPRFLKVGSGTRCRVLYPVADVHLWCPGSSSGPAWG